MIPIRSLLIPTATLAVFLFLGQARGHDFYSFECCSDRDCAPIDSKEIGETQEGFVIKSTGEFIERDKAKTAPDGQYHLCRNPITQTIICFYQPDRGA